MHRRHALVLLGGAMAAAASAEGLRPTQYLADKLGPLDLEATIPKAFGDWRMDTTAPAAVVNPQVSAALDRIYTEILSRTYVHTTSGYRIMLSIAYGRDQSDGLNAHDPAVCYPSQGFEVRKRLTSTVQTALGPIPVRQIEARLGNSRPEPVTYWMTMGEHVGRAGWQRKMAQMQYALRGLIADGLIFRVSSIDPEARRAFDRQSAFIAESIAATPRQMHGRLAGLGGDSSTWPGSG
jgi:EpsI family protein